MAGRTLVVGDIHGCSRAFALLLRMLQPTANDTLVVLGDVVDRGPDTAGVIDRLLELQQHCRLVTIRGNHEEMMLSALDGGDWASGWLLYGGREALDSYGGRADSIPEDHLELLRSFGDCAATDTCVFAHAGIDADVPLEEQTVRTLRWEHVRGNEPSLPDGRRIICGHTSQKSGLPKVWPGWLCLDTWVYGDGYLTGFDLEADHIYQASEEGDQRDFPLADIAGDGDSC